MRERSGGRAEEMDDVNGLENISKKVRKIASEIYPQYRQALLTSNALDFDDLILLARELLITNNEVRESLHRRWNHVLVDEFQDTSRVQLDLVKLLTTKSLLVVGDGDQSIYSWRGAHAESMANFASEFQGHCVGSPASNTADWAEDEDTTGAANVKTVFLMENYRSTTNIVRAAQKVISDPSSSKSKSDLERQDMKPMRGNGQSHECWPVPMPKRKHPLSSKAFSVWWMKESYPLTLQYQSYIVQMPSRAPWRKNVSHGTFVISSVAQQGHSTLGKRLKTAFAFLSACTTAAIDRR